MSDHLGVVHRCECGRRKQQGDESDESACKFSAPGKPQDHDCKHRDDDGRGRPMQATI